MIFQTFGSRLVKPKLRFPIGYKACVHVCLKYCYRQVHYVGYATDHQQIGRKASEGGFRKLRFFSQVCLS